MNAISCLYAIFVMYAIYVDLYYMSVYCECTTSYMLIHCIYATFHMSVYCRMYTLPCMLMYVFMQDFLHMFVCNYAYLAYMQCLSIYVYFVCRLYCT